ncbi:MAG: hypothetical protein ACYDG4_10775 [Desulfuromonadaceae bacterium]
MADSGWIKLYRKVRDHPFYKEKRSFSRFEAWTDLLLSASHKDGQLIFGNEVVCLPRGSLITSELKLMDRWRWSKTKLREFFSVLEKDNMIKRITDRKKTTISIVNYGLYHDTETTEDTTVKKKPIKIPKRDHKKTSVKPVDISDTAKVETNKDTTERPQKIHIQEVKNIKDMSNDISGKRPEPAVKNSIDYYFQSFLQKFGEKPAINGKKDGAILKRLLGTYGEDRLKGLIDAFFQSEDKFIKDSGYTIGVLSSQVNKLIAQGRKEQQSEPEGDNKRKALIKKLYLT